MVEQNEILQLLKERVRILSLIKDLYLRNQKLLASAQPDQLVSFEENQRALVQEMQTAELQWRTLVEKIKSQGKIQSENTDVIISLTLQENLITRYFAYKDQLYQVLSELERIRKNSHLMASNTFPFILRKKERSANQSARKSPSVKDSLKLAPPGKSSKNSKS